MLEEKLRLLEEAGELTGKCLSAVEPMLTGVSTLLTREILEGQRTLEKDQEGFDHQLSQLKEQEKKKQAAAEIKKMALQDNLLTEKEMKEKLQMIEDGTVSLQDVSKLKPNPEEEYG